MTMPEAVHYALAKRLDQLTTEIGWEEVRVKDHRRQLSEAEANQATLQTEAAEIAAYLAAMDVAFTLGPS